MPAVSLGILSARNLEKRVMFHGDLEGSLQSMQWENEE